MNSEMHTRKKPDRERLIYDVEALKVYFDPVRLRLLHEMIDQPRSVHELAAATDIPFTRLYYHIRLLEKHGFIRVVETRTGAGAIEEKYYQVSAYIFVVDRSLMVLGTPSGEAGFSAVQETVFDDTKRDIRQSIEAGLIDHNAFPPDPHALMARREILRLNPADARELHERLISLLLEFYNRGSKEGSAHYYNLVLILYPTMLDTDLRTDDPGQHENA
jgi:DNA-binding transcriptional ArsR family regulator